MKHPLKLSRILVYVLIFAAILLLIFSLFSHNDFPEITYGEVQELFFQENVKSFTWEDGTLTLHLRQPLAGDIDTVQHELADLDMFREELGPLYMSQKRSGVLESYDFAPVSGTPWYLAILPYVLIMVFFLILLRSFMNRAGGGDGGPGAKFSKANVRVGPGEKRVTFADVAGADEEKAELEEIVDFLKNPAKYQKIGARIPKGVLLVGPPGTGKTLIAKAVAGEANVQFFSISGSDFVELYVGVGASRVRDLFEQAKKCAPSIIFIDEIDAVGRHRGAGMGGGHDEREQTLNQLLVEMDGFGSNEGVIVMAATNRHDILDPALLRPGRFDRQIYVSPPDVRGREAILRVHSKNKNLADDVDLGVIARATSGFTGADLANLLNEAALASAKNNCPVITMKAIEDSIMKILAGPEKKSRVQLERDLRNTAYHEAGHAVSSYYLPTQDPVHHISIVPRGRTLGVTVYLPEHDTSNMTRNQMRESIVSLLGGRVAEELVFQDVSTGASNDLKRATQLAHDMAAKYGMCEGIGAISYDNGDEIFVGANYERTKPYSEQTAGAIDQEVKKIIDEAYSRCMNILKEHREQLNQVAEFLLAHENMSKGQFEACMEGRPIPEEAEGFFDAAPAAPADAVPADSSPAEPASEESPQQSDHN